ncbi:HNH endonuclease [Nocardia sp. NPDC056611]|uniref:HNH endonuclease n=1 Tax=Nocardia sp. NPDC056611 TaxID=3345877 RepID=UPI0036713E0C
MPSTTTAVRYRSGDSQANARLRLALLLAWKGCCYWCGKPRDFNEVDVDHIIPRSASPKDRDRLVEDLLGKEAVTAGYDIDAPANLGPICSRPCNIEKSNSLNRSNRFTRFLTMAREKAADVVATVASFESSARVVKALLAVTTADLDDGRTRAALATFAPLIDARLGALDYVTTEDLWDPSTDDEEPMVLVLDQESRRVRDSFEVLTGLAFDQEVLEPLDAVRAAVTDRLRDDIADQVEAEGHVAPDVSTPSGRLRIEIYALRYLVDEESFRISGSYTASMSAEAAVTEAHGDGLDYLQREAHDSGRFAVRFWCENTRIVTDFVDLDGRTDSSPQLQR